MLTKSLPLNQKSQDLGLAGLMSLRYVIGYGSTFGPKDALFDLSSQNKNNGKKILYLAGNNAVFANLETKEQVILPAMEGSLRISAVAVSADRTAIAIAEEVPPNSVISMYEYKSDRIRKKRQLISKDAEVSCYDSLVFGTKENSKLLFCVARTAGFRVVAWDFEKGRIKAACDFTGFGRISGLLFGPNDPELLFVFGSASSGLPVRSFWVRNEHDAVSVAPKNDLIKDFLKNYSRNFVKGCALADGSIVFGNDKGELILLSRQFELKVVLPNSPVGLHINSILPCGKGFMVACSRQQLILYDRQEKDLRTAWQRTDANLFPPTSEDSEAITGLLLLEEQSLIVGHSSGELLLVTLSAQRNHKFESAVNAFHAGLVSDIDLCNRKPYLVSCGADRTVKVWNYLENTLEFQKRFDKEVTSVSFHCSGLYIALAFKEKVKIMALTLTEIKSQFDVLIREATIVRFSNGGHLLATACDNCIQIWDFFSGEFRNNIILKSSDTAIVAMQWALDDLRIFACTADGTIVEVLLKEKLQEKLYAKSVGPASAFHLWNEYLINGPASMAVTTNNDRSLFVQCFNPEEENIARKLAEKSAMGQGMGGLGGVGAVSREAVSGSNDPSQQRLRAFKVDEAFGTAVISNSGKYLFCGTRENRGVVKVFSFPGMAQAAEINLNQVGVRKLLLTDDDLSLFVLGTDNSIYLIDLRDKEFKAKKNKEGITGYIEEVLVDEMQTRKLVDEIEMLSRKVAENEKLNELKILKDNRVKEEEIERINQKMLATVEERRERVREITSEIEAHVEAEKVALAGFVEAHAAAKAKMEAAHQTKMEKEKVKLEEVKAAFGLANETFKSQQVDLTQRHEERLAELRQQFHERLQQVDEELEALEEDIRRTEEECDTEIEGIESSLDRRIQREKALHERELEADLAERNQRDYEVNRCRIDFFSVEARKREEEKKQKDVNDEIKNITEEIFVLTKETENNEKEIGEREKTILQKLERINELIHKKQELDKFKFVLHYKIEELKKEKGPREIEIAKMRQQLQNMQQEISLFAKNYGDLKLAVSELRLKLQGQSKALRQSQTELGEKASLLTNFRGLLSEATTVHLNDYKELKKRLLFLYNTYAMNEGRVRQENVDKNKQFSEQRAYLENCLGALREKFGKNIALHKTDHKRAMKENVDLIGAINELKREKKFKIDNVERIKNLKRETKIEIENALEIRRNKETLHHLRDRLAAVRSQEPHRTGGTAFRQPFER